MEKDIKLVIISEGLNITLEGNNEEDFMVALDAQDVDIEAVTKNLKINITTKLKTLKGTMNITVNMNFEDNIKIIDALNEAFSYISLPV